MNTIVGDGFPIDLNIYPTDTPSSSPLCLLGQESQDHHLGFTLWYDQPSSPLSPDSPSMFLPSPYPLSSSPFVFSPPLPPGPPPPLLPPDTPSSGWHLSSPPLLPPDTPSSGWHLSSPPLLPPDTTSSGWHLSSPPLSPDSPLPSPPYTLSFSPLVFSPPLPPGPPPPLPLLPPDTPSSGRHLFSPPLPPGPPPLLLPTLRVSPLPVLLEQQFQQPSWNEEEEWHSYQASPWRNTEEERWSSIQASQRQEPEPRRNEEEERWSYWSNQASQRQEPEPRRNAEEERWSSIQRQEPWRDVIEEAWSNIQRQEPGQTTLTEGQIWEALDKLKNQEYIGEACAICLEYFVPEETVSITPCKHMFHKKCLVPWVMQKGQCPHCRFFLFEATRNRW